jgi:protein involved in polysaccharide export with SLBB domain
MPDGVNQVRRSMIPNIRTRLFSPALSSAVVAAVTICLSHSLTAQQRQLFESRSELEARAKVAKANPGAREASLIAYRLEHGDFQDGDRIIVKVIRGSAGFSDTLLVRSGKKITLPQMGDFSLEGVLRSELVPALTAHMAKFIKDPVVDAMQLTRIGIVGSVGRPGFYYAPADIPLTDVLMAAGGPSQIADLDKVKILRNGDLIVDEENSRRALTAGMSMDMLHMQAGDEISVGQQHQTNWLMMISVASTALGLLLAFAR